MGWLDGGLGASQLFCTGYAFNPLFQLPLASGFSIVRVFVLNQLYHLRELNAKCILSTHCLRLPHPSLGTFLQECSYRLLGKMSVQMWRKWASDQALVCHKWQLPISITITFINFAFHFPSSPQLPFVEMLKFWLSEATVILPQGLVEKGRGSAQCSVFTFRTK